MAGMLTLALNGFLLVLRTRRSLMLENLALRHQLAVLQRSSPRPRLRISDRLLWVLLCRLWSGWANALSLVKPETVIRWHRTGFKLFWTWKSRRNGPGRPAVAPEVRALIRRMSKVNALWGAPRVHGELQKLGVVISQAAVSKYMDRSPPSPTCRTFLDNHLRTPVPVAESVRGTPHRNPAPRVPRPCGRAERDPPASPAARLPRLLPPCPDPPLIGEGLTRAETGGAPRPRPNRRDAHGRRTPSSVQPAGCVRSRLPLG